MGWFSKKPKTRYIAIIAKASENKPRTNEFVYISEKNSLLQAKSGLMLAIGAKTYPNIHFETDGKVLKGDDALKAISEAIIPFDSFNTSKERNEYYENFSSVQLSFYSLDEHMYRTVYGLCIVRRDDE